MTKKVVLFVVLAVALLLSACGPAALTGVEVVYDVPSTVLPTREPTVEVTPTLEPTPTPTEIPTDVVEYPSPDQEWILEAVFPFVREAGCVPSYTASYYPEFANSIAWTVDEAGSMVQGITELDFCGGAEASNYLGFQRIGFGWPESYIVWGQANNIGVSAHTLGPNYHLSPFLVAVPGELTGFLSVEGVLQLRELFSCLFPNALEGVYVELLIPASEEVLNAFRLNNLSWAIPETTYVMCQ